MTYLTAILVVLVTFASPALASSIEIGMPESKLIELKGSPVSKAALGNKTICRWSDMEVTLIQGKVDHIQYRDPKSERNNAVHSAGAAAKKKAETDAIAAANRKKNITPEGPATDFFVQVVEVLPQGGAVVDLLEIVYSRGRADSMQSIGGGGGFGSGGVSYQQSGKLAYLPELAGCVDGDRYKVNAAPAGKYSYDRNTIRRFIVYQATRI